MNALAKDFTFTLRTLVRSPWLILAVLELALGIGAVVVIFSVLNGLYLKPLPFPEPERLVQIQMATPEEQSATFGGSRFDFWRRNGGDIFAAIAAYDAQAHGFKLRTAEGTEVISGSRVSGEFFRVFGVAPRLGRALGPEDDRPGAPRVAVLSHQLWQRTFASDPGVIGRTLPIDDEDAEIVGVMPPGFRHPARAALWAPLRLEADSRASVLQVTARLEDGASRAGSLAQLEAVDRRFRGLQTGQDSREQLLATPLQDFLYGDLRPALMVLLAAMALVLLIACANVANLLLARSATRQRELAIRIAIGASPQQVMRLLLIEGVTLATAAGLLSLVVCAAALGPILALAPPDVRPQLASVGLDPVVFAFALLLSFVTGLAVGVLPALRARRTDVREAIQEESTGSGATGGRSGRRLRYGMVVLEIALALVLMISAGLLIKSFAGLRSTPLGFATENLLTLKTHLGERHAPPSEMARLESQLLPEIEALPGARRAALATSLPLELGADMPFVTAAEIGAQQATGFTQYRGVSDGYFETLGVGLLRGRTFTAADRQDAPLVAVINEAAAQRFFPGGDAIGQRVVIGLPDMPEQADATPREIVGVVRDVRETGLESEAPTIFYVPLEQVPESLNRLLVQLLPLNLVVRTDTAPLGLSREVQQAVWSHDPELSLSDVTTMQGIVERSVGADSFQMVLVGSLAALALILSLFGTYAVLMYLVGQRTRELGVRIALGGDPGRITRQVVGEGMAVVLIGVAVGVAGAWIATRLLARFLYGVSASDPATFVLVALSMTAVAFVATLLPARRAAKISPMEALKWS